MIELSHAQENTIEALADEYGSIKVIPLEDESCKLVWHDFNTVGCVHTVCSVVVEPSGRRRKHKVVDL